MVGPPAAATGSAAGPRMPSTSAMSATKRVMRRAPGEMRGVSG
jgi:hypothetical protein